MIAPVCIRPTACFCTHNRCHRRRQNKKPTAWIAQTSQFTNWVFVLRCRGPRCYFCQCISGASAVVRNFHWTLGHACGPHFTDVELDRNGDVLGLAMRKTLKFIVLVVALTTTSGVVGQITSPRVLSSSRSTSATLEEQLLNRLKATRDDQRGYVKHIVALTKNGKLDRKLVVAVERYALRRNAQYPFPFFERALKYEAAKRRVVLPTVRNFASTRPSAPAAGSTSP